MPPHSSDILDNIVDYTAVAAKTLQDIVVVTQIPFLDGVCTLSLTIILIVQTTKFQRERCIRILEEIHQGLCALAGLCIHSDDIRSSMMLDQIAQYALTLQKIHMCLKALREAGTLKRLFRKSEIAAQLDSCERELRAASELFTMKSGVGITTTLVGLNMDTENRHQELLELISSLSGSINTASSIGRSSLDTSSGSLSLLPASPKIFHGRDSELNDLITTLLSDPARAAILGPGGMGKTTLATAASATTCGDLATTIGFHLGLDSSLHISNAIVQHFGQCGPCLVVLDNLETPWEPLESRGEVEEFISLLTDVPHLALLAPGGFLAQPSYSAPFPLEKHYETHSDLLSAHRLHLQSLLDSALATLTLIHDIAPPTAPILTSHATEVLQALLRRALIPTPSPHSTPTTAPTQTCTPTKNATYAEAMAGTATDTPRAETPLPSHAPPAPAERQRHVVRPDLIFRLDLETITSNSDSQPTPGDIFAAVEAKGVLGNLSLDNVRWTQAGNLACSFVHDGKFKPEDAMARAPVIWGILGPLLGFPAGHPCPRVDTGDPWHSVVVYNVPLPSPSDKNPVKWLRKGGFTGSIRSGTELGQDTQRKTAAFRLALSSRADAETAVKDGVLLFGSRCRVSHYVARPRTQKPSV
ncbi:hypothetical protein B0H13DRAFT_2441141 [Mycena leptocephala]|nr:hypothetical protein B0H13DRAFT_2441141 [Mycena leptocephala]